MKSISAAFLSLLAAALLTPSTTQAAPKPPKDVRLYVFDCGMLHYDDPSRFNFKKEEVKVYNLSVGCYMVVHPKGILMWDTGVIPDSAFTPGGGNPKLTYAEAFKPLKQQMMESGYSAGDVTYLALSHYHWDHIGNANQFASATWLARKIEYDAMMNGTSDSRYPEHFSELKKSKVVMMGAEDHDVFGDGTVILKFAPGHTPGHQVLFVKLKKTGPVMLSGDLYHLPEELKFDRTPVNEVNREQTLESRKKIQAFLKENHAQLWIQHDFAANAKLRKAPLFYE